MRKIAAVMLTHNESFILKALLSAHRSMASSVDYFFVADSGSEDDTRKTLKPLATQIFNADNSPLDFSALRNTVQRFAIEGYPDIEYFLHVDADEEWTPKLMDTVRSAVDAMDFDIGIFPRRELMNAYAKKRIREIYGREWADPYPDWQGRLLRKGMQWYGKVHETAVVPGVTVARFVSDPILHHHDIGKRYPHSQVEYERRVKR